MNANCPLSGTVLNHMENLQSNYGSPSCVCSWVRESAICFHVHYPRRAVPYVHTYFTLLGLLHKAIPKGVGWKGKEKAATTWIWGCGMCCLLTHFVIPSLQLATTQNSCFALKQRSLWYYKNLRKEWDTGMKVMPPLGVDFSSFVWHKEKAGNTI